MATLLRGWGFRNQKYINGNAANVARESRGHIPSVVVRRLARMTYFEARGYLRVSAVAAVDDLLGKVGPGLKLDASQRSAVRDQAVELLVERVLADRAIAPQRPLRKAA